jgi:hypothetical protein
VSIIFRMANVCTEATATRSILSTNSVIASLAKAISTIPQKERTSDHIADVWNVSRLRRTTKLTRKTHSRGIPPYCTDCTSSNQVRTKLKGVLDVIFFGKGRGSNIWKQHVQEIAGFACRWGLLSCKLYVMTSSKPLITVPIFRMIVMLMHWRWGRACDAEESHSKEEKQEAQPFASPDASLSCQQVTPASDESSMVSLLHPNPISRQAEREWANRQKQGLSFPRWPEAESIDC